MKMSSPRRIRGAALTNLLLLVIVAAVAAGGWYGWHALQQQQRASAALEEQITSLKQGQQAAAEAAASAASERETRIGTLEQRLEQNTEALRDMASGGQRNWLLNEAQALAALAEERLLLTADLAAARRLLAAADETLARSNDPDVLPARRALAQDMEALEAARQVDVPALVLRLGAVASTLPDVVVAGASAQANQFSQRKQQAEGDWLDQMLARLPVQVTRTDSVAMPLNADQAKLVRLHLDTLLLQAQLALMQGRPDIYQKALSQAHVVLDAWYPSTHTGVSALRASLEDLADAPVQQALPDIGAGRKAIRNLQAAEAS